MKIHHQSLWSRRPSLGLTLLLTLGLPAAALAAQDMTSTSTTTTTTSGVTAESDKTMAAYIQAAGEQLDGYRQAINVDPPLPREDAAGLAKDKLTKCDELLTQLKEADANHFDGIKARFETCEADLAQAVQAATRP
jgi:hypothetical protein